VAAIAPYRMIVRDKNRTRIGEIQRMTALSLIPRYNDVGSWSVTLPKGHRQASLLAEGGWVTFMSRDYEIMSGIIRGIKENWDDQNSGAGTLTAYGPSTEQVLADRLAYQVPASVATSQSATDYDRRNGAGETVIKAYVNVNAGPGALAARRTPSMTVDADLGRGATVTGSARMDNLLTLIQGLATAAGLGFRVVFGTDDTLAFSVFVPVDRSGIAKFGKQLGNLVSYEYVREASKSSDVIVGGTGDGTARIFREIIDTQAQALWGNRSETFVDRRDTSDTFELDQAGAEEAVTNGPTTAMSIKTVDTPQLMFARDYYLGDRVTVVDPGAVTDVLTEVQIEWTADKSPSTTSTVGSKSTQGTSKMITKMNEVARKIIALETKK
jgi:hypothetical protein